MSGYPNQPPAHAMSYPQYYTGMPPAGQPGVPPAQPGYPAPQAFNHPGYPGQPAPGQPGFPTQTMQPQNAQYPPQPGFAYPNVYPQINPTPTAPASAPPPSFGYSGYPNVSPQPSYGPVQWIQTTANQASSLSDRAVVAGYEGQDGSPIWVIRARHEGDLIPGKLPVKHRVAYVPWGGKENAVQNIEVCCAPPEKIKWVESRDGVIPPNAIAAGHTSSGEPLYVGRAKEQGSLTPGKVHPSHKVMYISFAGREVPHKVYEVMCNA